MTMLKRNAIDFSIIFFIFLLDRFSKYFIIKLSDPMDEMNIQINSFINFNLIWNKGIGFGLLSFDQDFLYNIITFIIILITIIILWYCQKTSGLEKISYLVIVGGSSGNIFDRIYYSSVADFIDISINNFHWFIFNVADIFISIGVITLIMIEIFYKKKI
jgi:signal peptidase II